MRFFRGMDVSMLKEMEARGASYSLHGEQMDIFKIMKICGVDLIRLRLWNDPYCEEGEGYGGGTNDLGTTMELAKRVIKNGLDYLLDFHYSDFWADPSKQYKPKAWENLSGEVLEGAVYEYTAYTLRQLKRASLPPKIVQIGNEITNGLLWPDGKVENTKQMAGLLRAGIEGVKAVCPECEIVLHLDFGTDNKLYRDWFSKIEPYHLEYDIIGMSYYPHWNGGIDKLLENMNDISSMFQKDVMVAETSIGYTTDDLGCRGLVFSKEQEEATGYAATMEGQEAFLKDLYAAVRKVKEQRGRGVIYWEPDWIAIPECTWAQPKGAVYMKEKVEVGNSNANQALFDKNGNANPALIHLGQM